jgi:hypothetical protein
VIPTQSNFLRADVALSLNIFHAYVYVRTYIHAYHVCSCVESTTMRVLCLQRVVMLRIIFLSFQS